MTGSAYAAGWPFEGFGRRWGCSAFEELKDEVLAAMGGRRGHGGHHQGFGGQWGGAFGGPLFAPPWAGPGGPRGWKGPKARRGDVRAAILAVLAEQPMNGYQIIQVVAERSGGAWKPSPGSIYPTLQQLEDEGLVRADAAVGRRTFTLTDEGRTYVAEHADEVSAPWEAMSANADEDENGLKPLLGQVGTALWQVLATGTPEQQAKARKALVELRRTLYGILQNDDEQDRS
ncbi:transcriptional regulator, PadR-like family [Kribbella flavida DSM 17836]|uniref:Transcriptional regulator, PadR-like family n=1 Tax=Kribbella flavida (strain DSM 17836 / JCM 10339 / NBRC 14399) TaxID=479435 RepID=D2PQ95_KRIFD|nr:PadR family transcriptional regulator [Kribbella flavida]ADB34797.1 transcriptional regulator, PadR-like family [Kribbella flavida DSM 17836]